MKQGTNQAIGGGGFHHVAIKTRNFDESISFYTRGFGFVPKVEWGKTPRRAVMLDTGDGNYLEVFEDLQYDPQPNGVHIHFALRTSDCDAAIERARAAGAEITKEPTDIEIPSSPPTSVRLAFCKGPEGAVIEFFQNATT